MGFRTVALCRVELALPCPGPGTPAFLFAPLRSADFVHSPGQPRVAAGVNALLLAPTAGFLSRDVHGWMDGNAAKHALGADLAASRTRGLSESLLPRTLMALIVPCNPPCLAAQAIRYAEQKDLR